MTSLTLSSEKHWALEVEITYISEINRVMFIARVDSTDKASFFLDKGKIVLCESVN